MARPVPAVERVVAVLDLLAAHPEEELTLAELCRRLDMSKATGHALVNALADARYLLRHPVRKTYTLGPALLGVASSVEARYRSIVEHARDEMQALSEELDIRCVASAALGDEIVLLEVTGKSEPFGLNVQAGQRVPLVPPLGTVFMAWSSDEEIDRWLRRVGPGATDAEIVRYRRAIETVRRRGYSIGLEADARRRLGLALSEEDRTHLATAIDDLAHEEYILLELDGSADYLLSHVAAPVFSQDGRVVLALTLIDFRRQVSAREVPELGERLLLAARNVSTTVGDGSLPHGSG